MMSPLQKKDTGKIKSKEGHADPASLGTKDFKAMDNGSRELQSPKPMRGGGLPMPSRKGDPTLPGDPPMSEVTAELEAKRNARAKAMDAAHRQGKKNITKAANEE